MKTVKKWKPKLLCRMFGCKFEDTEHEVMLLPFLATPLERCTRCQGGRVFGLFGPRLYTPQAVDNYVAEQNGIREGSVVALREFR